MSLLSEELSDDDVFEKSSLFEIAVNFFLFVSVQKNGRKFCSEIQIYS